MPQTLDYANPAATDLRWSRQALVALAVSILQIPLFFLVVSVLGALSPPPAVTITGYMCTVFIPPVTGFVFGIGVIIRHLFGRDRRRGWWLGGIAALLSAAWPTALIWYTITHLHFA